MKKGRSSVFVASLIFLSLLLLVLPSVFSSQDGFTTVCYGEKHSIINHEMICEVTNDQATLSDREIKIDLNLKKKVLRGAEIFEFVDKVKEVATYEEVCDLYNETFENGTVQYDNCTSVENGTEFVSYVEVERLNVNPDSKNVEWSAGDMEFDEEEIRRFLIKWKTDANSEGNWKINPEGWWNSTWGFKKDIIVSETSGANLTNYSVLLNVTKESEMQSDYDDLRFVYDNNELIYYIESNNSNYAMVYVKVPELNASENTTIEMYYNNSGASGISNMTGIDKAGMIAYWDLDETSGNLDDSVGSNDLIEQGTVSNNIDAILGSSRGKFSNGNYFSDTDVMSLDDDISFTIGTWAYWDGTSSNYGRIFNVGDYSTNDFYGFIGFDASNYIEFKVGKWGDGYTLDIVDNTMPQNQWVYLVGTYNGGTKIGEFFINGISQGIDTYTHSSPVASTRVSIGDGWFGTTGWTGGYLDESALYDRVLTSSEISEQYASGDGKIVYASSEPTSSFGSACPYDTLAPQTTTPTISPASPNTGDDLSCNATLTDNVEDGDLSANWTWYKDGVVNLSGTTMGIENDTDTLIAVLSFGNTSKGENWTCGVVPFDGYNWGNESNGSVVIGNTAPDVPTILLPVNDSGYAMNSIVTFVWNNSVDVDGDSLTYNLYIYNESDMAAGNLVYSNTSIAEGTDNTSISVRLSDYWDVDDDYYWYVRANDSEDVGNWSEVGNFQYANWTITFNLTDGETGEKVILSAPGKSYLDMVCDNGLNVVDSVTNPYIATNGFAPGSYSCNVSATDYFQETINFVADQDKNVTVPMSPSGGLEQEEHTWLEAIYDCVVGGDCTLYDMITNINDTVTNIWEHTAPTDESVVLSEVVTNKVVNSTNNLTIDYSVYIPIKAGYSFGDYLPVRIGFFFLDNATNTTCYNQGEEMDGVNSPSCSPLIVETIGPMGGTVNFTVELQPSLVSGDNYTIKRVIDIDPLGVWYNYGSEVISDLIMMESLSVAGVGLEKTGDFIPDTNTPENNQNSGGSTNSHTTIIEKVYVTEESEKDNQIMETSEEEVESVVSGITGAVVGVGENLLSGSQLVLIIAMLCIALVVVTINRSKTKLKLAEH